MKKFFDNLKRSLKYQDISDAPFLGVSLAVVGIFVAIVLFASTLIMLYNFPVATIATFLLVCLGRLIYAGVTGK